MDSNRTHISVKPQIIQQKKKTARPTGGGFDELVVAIGHVGVDLFEACSGGV